MIYFTSDQHFHHGNAIKFTNRPFRDAVEMNLGLIENWNRRVGPQDEVYFLGDVTPKGPGPAMEVLRQLNGRKYLLRGNHDLFVDKASFDRSIFEWIKDYHRLVYQGCRFILFHYPIESWDQRIRGAIHLHGHEHNGPDYNRDNAEKKIFRYDVGVDANNMAPVSIDEILLFFSLMGTASS